ncbi:MAG: hypothetical protein WBK20_13950 [Spirochaetota bacterium]
MTICLATGFVLVIASSNVKCDAPMERAIANMNKQPVQTSIILMFVEIFFIAFGWMIVSLPKLHYVNILNWGDSS